MFGHMMVGGLALLGTGGQPGEVQPQHTPYPSPSASQFLAPIPTSSDVYGTYAPTALLAEEAGSQPRRLTAIPNGGFPTRPFAASYTMIGRGTCVDATGHSVGDVPGYQSWVGPVGSYPDFSACRDLCNKDAECEGYEQSGWQTDVGGDGNCLKFAVYSIFEDKAGSYVQ